MALFNYIRKRSHDDVAFAKFDRNFNFVSDDISADVIAYSGSHENCSPCQINFVHDEIVDSLM